MITEATIGHYKSIADAHLKFGRVNVLVGPNGVGKSNFVDALYFVHDCVVHDLDTAVVKRHGIESIRQWSKTKPYHVSIELKLQNEEGSGAYRFTLSSGAGSYTIVEESGEWTGPDRGPANVRKADRPQVTTKFTRNKGGKVSIRTGKTGIKISDEAKVDPSELFLTTIAGPITFLFLAFEELIEELRSFVTYSIYPNTLRQPQVVTREDVLHSDGANLASILRNIGARDRRAKENLLASIQVIMPQVSDMVVKSAGGFYVPVLKVREANGEGHEFNMSQVSDGTLRVLGLLTAFYQPKVPGIIAVEEPEQMIHPGVLPVIADAAKEYASRHTNQVFITTHSPTLLDLFEPEAIIWTTNRQGLTELGEITPRQLGMIKRQLFTAGEIFLSEGFFG